MCAISASPEAGDATVTGIMSRKKCSAISAPGNSKNAFLSGRDKNAYVSCVPTSPSNPVNNAYNDVREEFSAIQDDILRGTSDVEHGNSDYCGFPYYRFDVFARLNTSIYEDLLGDVKIMIEQII